MRSTCVARDSMHTSISNPAEYIVFANQETLMMVITLLIHCHKLEGGQEYWSSILPHFEFTK